RRKAWAQPQADLRVELANGTWLMINERRMSDGGRVAIYTDITDLKQREEELRAQSAILEATLENMEQGISMVNSQFKVVSFNRKFLEFMQFPPSEFPPGFPMEHAFRFNAERGEYGEGDVGEMVAERMELASRFEPHRFERTRKDGVVLEIVGNPVKTGGFVTTYSDVTERKEREDELRRARDVAEKTLSELQEAQERLIQAEKMASLGQLTAGIAHEIKNPLNFVNNFAKLSGELMDELSELLQKPIAALDEEAREDADDIIATIGENLEKIHEHGARADSIVRNMLLHSRDGPRQIQSTSINAIADEALKLAYHGARTENASFNIEMKTDFDDDAGNIDCFPQDLMRAFLNLVSNGMYAASQKNGGGDNGEAAASPEIEIVTKADGDKVHVDIKDNGVGIPAELREKILTPFFTTKPAGEGTGLGLSLTYDIVVKQHAGDLTIESEPGAFTVFRITLPRRLEAT
ncbi:MAG: PAS-domain containing protein, partial [Hyphomicrobiales bacterium]